LRAGPLPTRSDHAHLGARQRHHPGLWHRRLCGVRGRRPDRTHGAGIACPPARRGPAPALVRKRQPRVHDRPRHGGLQRGLAGVGNPGERPTHARPFAVLAELDLDRPARLAIVPPSLSSAKREGDGFPEALPVLHQGVRGALVGVVLGIVAVFVVAASLNPYGGEGRPRQMATPQRLGLPPCTFYDVTGLPCPSCGMTTSFAFLVRGDVKNSLRANWVGTLLAAFCVAFIPWALVGVARR